MRCICPALHGEVWYLSEISDRSNYAAPFLLSLLRQSKRDLTQKQQQYVGQDPTVRRMERCSPLYSSTVSTGLT